MNLCVCVCVCGSTSTRQAMDMDESNVDLRSTIAIDRANALLRLKRFEEVTPTLAVTLPSLP